MRALLRSSVVGLLLGLTVAACDCGDAELTSSGCQSDADCPEHFACVRGLCVPRDTDGDGIPDSADNCVVVVNPAQEDMDIDGIGDVCDPDRDGDDVPNDPDNCADVVNPEQADLDEDGIGDYCDDDWDGDGVKNEPDNCPRTPNADQRDLDRDGRGDACDGDRDGDGIPNDPDNCPDVVNVDQANLDRDALGDACDDDRDGDGIPNLPDNCPDVPNTDQADLDQDGTGDACDDDVDGDGVRNEPDNCPRTPNADQLDQDQDGLGDVCDDDRDGDGVLNVLDNCAGTFNPDQADLDRNGVGNVCDDDIDGDGVLNPQDNCVYAPNPDQADLDADGLGDACDDDVDGDGIRNPTDNCRTTPNPDQADLDRDAIGDRCDDDVDGDRILNPADNCLTTFNPTQADLDRDGKGDACDDDRDGDGIVNTTDNCPDTPNPEQADLDRDGRGDVCDTDRDGDGVLNPADNCPDTPNTNQADLDRDGRGDACDDDRDGDGVLNPADNCPDAANPDQADLDRDGKGDACDDDVDGDGVKNTTDNCVRVPNANQRDLDRDGKGDACDDDLDGDGVLNTPDNCVDLANADQVNEDADAIGDACDDTGVRDGQPTDPNCRRKNRLPFSPTLKWHWSGVPGHPTFKRVMTPPVVADLDADGTPEVVFIAYQTAADAGYAQPFPYYLGMGALVVADGRTGATKWAVGPWSSPTMFQFSSSASVAVANLDGSADGTLEIVAVKDYVPASAPWPASSDLPWLGGLYVFKHDGTLGWNCYDASTGTNNCRSYVWPGASSPFDWGAASIADLDGDGNPEIVYGATALKRTATGKWTTLWDHRAEVLNQTMGAGNNSVSPLSVVADLDLDGSPEVVTGRTAYRGRTGSVYWNAVANSFFGNATDGYPAIGNFDADENPEIVVVANGSVHLREHDGRMKWGPVRIPFPATATGPGAGGPPTVADFDGDGRADIGVASKSRYTVFKGDGSVLWSTPVVDESSSTTGSSVFDFQGDGWAEVVHADEQYLRVFDGETGVKLWEKPTESATAVEYPVVADVDADGHADIVVGANPYGTPNSTSYGVYAYGSADWVPTRSLWNQYQYAITNVLDDGSVESPAPESWLPATFEGWPVGGAGGTFRANASQPPGGFYTYLPDVQLQAALVDPRQCSASFRVRVWLDNRGLQPVAANAVRVSAYRGTVQSASALLATKTNPDPIAPGQGSRMYFDVAGLPAGTKVLLVADPASPIGSGGALEECNESAPANAATVTNPCP